MPKGCRPKLTASCFLVIPRSASVMFRSGQLDYFFRQRPCYSHRRPTAELPITITINGCGYGFLVANQTHSRFAVAIKASLQISKNIKNLLLSVFDRAKHILHKDAVVYVRTDHRDLTLNITTDVLKEVFPKKRIFRYSRRVEKPTQTHLFKNKVEKSAEVDIVLLPAA